MTNNMRVSSVNSLDEQRIVKAQSAVWRAYRRLSGKGGWRAVGKKFGLKSHVYAYELAMYGKVPSNPEIRHKLGLPRVLPSERVGRVTGPRPKVWERPELYFKDVQKFKGSKAVKK